MDYAIALLVRTFIHTFMFTLCFVSDSVEQAQTSEHHCEHWAVKGISSRSSTYVSCTCVDSFPTESRGYLKW